MIRKGLALGFVLALGLVACDRDSRSPVQPNGIEEKGSASIALPKLPAGYLADSGQQALFSLTITGSGMDPIMKSWYLNPDGSQPILVDGIPVGVRSFLGRLIRIDPKTGDTTITHEGADSAYISRGTTANVYLYLRAGGFGSAHVCVEIEGWPADTTCIPPPPPPPPPPVGLYRCYQLQLRSAGPDTVIAADLQIFQTDSSLVGIVLWPSGASDTARGMLSPGPGPVAYFGYDGTGDFLFKAIVDSAGTLSGPFIDRARGISSAMGFAYPKPCGGDTMPPPPPPPPYPVWNVAGCYALTVTKPGPAQDSLFRMKLRLTQRDTALLAVFSWGNGYSDTLPGAIYPGGVILLSSPGNPQHYLKGMIDTIRGIYAAYYSDPARGITGSAVAPRAACTDSVPPNQTVSFDSVLCWQVAQKTADGRAMQGTLWAGWHRDSLVAWFQWKEDPMGFRMDNRDSPAKGSTLSLYGTLPGGFAHPIRSAIENGQYKARFTASGLLEAGTAYARAGTFSFGTADKFADWSGSPYACPQEARTTLTKVRNR